MRKIIFISCITILCSYTVTKIDKSRTDKFQLFYESKVEDKQKIEQIKNNIIMIDKMVNTYCRVAKTILGYSSEGGILIFYYDKEIIKKIIFNVCGEMGRCTDKYYLNDKKKLMAIESEDIDYDRPFHVDCFKIKSKKIRTYYFNDGIPMYIINKQHPNSKEIIDNFMKYLVERIYSLSEIMEMFNNPELEILPDDEIPRVLLQDN